MLFLNNAIDQGIYYPLGLQQITQPANDEQEWIEQATGIWPDFYDSIGGKEKLDEVLSALGRDPAPQP